MEKDDPKIEDIFSMSKETYGKDYDEKLFEQYRIYIKNIDSLENRRKITHGFFLSINTGLIAALGILAQFGTAYSANNQLWLVGGGVAGILFAYSWLRTIRSYIQLGTVKWDIVLEIEKKLPLKIHEVEWDVLTLNKNRWKKYTKLTDVELAIPLIFIALYGLFLLIIIGIVDISFVENVPTTNDH